MTHELLKSVDQAAIGRWAELTGDHNRLHVDEDFAAGTRYQGTIVHGHLTIAWIMEWAVALWGPDWIRHGQVTGLRFAQPLRPDVTYRVVGQGRGDGSVVDLAVLLSDGRPAVTAVARLGTGGTGATGGTGGTGEP